VVWDVREYLPGMSAWSAHPRWKPAHVALEREFGRFADAVVTVSEPLADMLAADFSLPERPAVVLNAPVVTDPPATCERDVRSDCALSPDTPLVVYSGGAAPQRGLEVMIDALPNLPGVHTAFVVLAPGHTANSEYVGSLKARAEEAGVAGRVHFLAYVDSDEVVAYLSTADVGVFPGLPYVNHTISLITKFLEYSHARLPIVVSNLKTMAATVTETGQGEVFEPEDVGTYVVAISKVLADRESYRRAYDDADRMHGWTWEPQADVLDQVYRGVLASDPRLMNVPRG
jgi:glycogen synthase